MSDKINRHSTSSATASPSLSPKQPAEPAFEQPMGNAAMQTWLQQQAAVQGQLAADKTPPWASAMSPTLCGPMADQQAGVPLHRRDYGAKAPGPETCTNPQPQKKGFVDKSIDRGAIAVPSTDLGVMPQTDFRSSGRVDVKGRF